MSRHNSSMSLQNISMSRQSWPRQGGNMLRHNSSMSRQNWPR